MVATKRQAGHNDFRLTLWDNFTAVQLVAHDAVIGFGVKAAVIEPNASAAMVSFGKGATEVLDEIGMSIALCILERDEEAASGHLSSFVVRATPRIDIDGTVLGDGEMTGMANPIGEHGRAKTARQGDAARVTRAGVVLLARRARQRQHREGESERQNRAAVY